MSIAVALTVTLDQQEAPLYRVISAELNQRNAIASEVLVTNPELLGQIAVMKGIDLREIVGSCPHLAEKIAPIMARKQAGAGA